MIREIIPGRERTYATVTPPNPVHHAYSRIPVSQQLDAPRLEPEAPYRGEWCHEFGFWKAVECNSTPSGHVPTGEVAKPLHDGSGVHWRVVCNRTGATLWRIEAYDFDSALAEKRRLSKISGGRSGYCYLVQDPGPRPAIQRAIAPAPAQTRVTSEGGLGADGRMSGRLVIGYCVPKARDP